MVSKKVQHFGVGPLKVFEKFRVGGVVWRADNAVSKVQVLDSLFDFFFGLSDFA